MKNWYIEHRDWTGQNERLKQRNIYQDRKMPYFFHRDVMATPNGQLAWQDFYLVHVTHPDQPNYSGHSRSRKSHFSLTNKQGDRSLCDRLVDFVHREYIDIRKDNKFSANGATASCVVCTEKALALVKEWKKG